MHKVEIPAEIVAACLARRGRQHVYDELDPTRTAVVVIDMQNSWLEQGLSKLEIPTARAIIPNINRLAAAARASGGTVAWTRSVFDPAWTRAMYAGFGPAEWIDRIIDDSAEGAHGHAIHEGMDWQSGDITVVKNRPSAFIQGSSDLETRLRERGCDTLIMTGTLTNACCESSTRDAVALGFRVVFVSDATATRSDIEHNATLINLMQLVADVRPTSEVLELLQAAG